MPCENICSPWKKCSKDEISLLFVTPFSFSVIIFLTSLQFWAQSEKLHHELNGHERICMTEKCVRSAANILKNMDKTVAPCDDFYRFVCGNFVKNTEIPEDKSVVNKFSMVSDKVKLQMKILVTEPFHESDPKPLKLLKTVYKSCMNITRIENEALTFVKKVFKELGFWPLIDQNFNERKFDWKNFLYRLRRSGWNHNIFVKMQIEPDVKDSSRRVLTVTQPSAFAYQALKRGFADKDTQAYYEYMVQTARLFGAADLAASVEMAEVLSFEMNLTNIIIPYRGRRNLSSEYNPMTIRDLQQYVNGIPWLQLINNFLAPIEMLTSRDIINVAFPKYLKDLEDLLSTTKKRILANYIFWYIVRNSISHLPERFRNQKFQYLKATTGIKQSEPRWSQCFKELDKLHIAASSIFVKKFFSKEDKKAVSKISSFIKEAFIEDLRDIEWMDAETKNGALVKAEKMGLFIGYPEEILNEEVIEEYYREMDLPPDDYYLKMNLILSSFLHKKRVEKLREVIVKSEWTSQAYSYQVNGFYDQRSNVVEIMAALMTQEDFFASRRPQYLNFGSIGEIIGHEIIHGFDDEGVQHDENGNMVDWWTLPSLEIFRRKSECLIRQYKNLSIAGSGPKINAENTLNENIADNGGFKIAYKGYLKWLERSKEEDSLPGLPYTSRQMFWIAAATDGCSKYRKEALERISVSGKHAPEYFRIMVPFMNSNFGEDFNCSLGSVMNPENKCHLW